MIMRSKSKELGQPHQYGLVVIAQVVSLLGWVCSWPAAFLKRCSKFWALLTSWGCNCIVSFIPSQRLLAPSQGSFRRWVAASLTPRRLHSVCLKNQHWMKNTGSAVCLNSRRAPLDHGCSALWVPRRLSTVKWILEFNRRPLLSRGPRNSS